MLSVTICTIVSLSLLAGLLTATGVTFVTARGRIAGALAFDAFEVRPSGRPRPA